LCLIGDFGSSVVGCGDTYVVDIGTP
jgi:hypothetical protein